MSNTNNNQSSHPQSSQVIEGKASQKKFGGAQNQGNGAKAKKSNNPVVYQEMEWGSWYDNNSTKDK
jgi:hypothetical protein